MTYRAEYAAPHTWACTAGPLSTTTIHDTQQAAEEYAAVMNERLAWARIERGHLMQEKGL